MRNEQHHIKGSHTTRWLWLEIRNSSTNSNVFPRHTKWGERRGGRLSKVITRNILITQLWENANCRNDMGEFFKKISRYLWVILVIFFWFFIYFSIYIWTYTRCISDTIKAHRRSSEIIGSVRQCRFAQTEHWYWRNGLSLLSALPTLNVFTRPCKLHLKWA